jgi:hypothetical protein
MISPAIAFLVVLPALCVLPCTSIALSTRSIAALCAPACSLDTGECDGCFGGSDANASSANPSCPGASVTISVTVSSAACTLVAVEPLGIICKPTDCSATVYRSWTGVTPNTSMDFCVKPGPGARRMCLDTDSETEGVQGPSSGSGTGNETLNPDVKCGGGGWVFSIGAACGSSGYLSASATGTCTDHCS